MRKLTVVLFSLLALQAAMASQAPRYTYGGIGYEFVDIDDANLDGDGIVLEGSLAINDWAHGILEYRDLDLDFGVDYEVLKIGGGGNYAIAPNIDLVGRLGFADADVSGRSVKADDDGYFLEAGARWMVNDQLEIAGFIEHVDLDRAGDETGLRGEALYNVMPNLAVGGSLLLGDDETAFGFNVRYYFDDFQLIR